MEARIAGFFLFDRITTMSHIQNNLYEAVLRCIEIKDPLTKVDETRSLYQLWCAEGLNMQSLDAPMPIPNPGRPEKPDLVSPHKVPKRGFKSKQGLVRLAHAIAHIEFNAINLALDAVYRFRQMPEAFVSDWLKVAAEESSHFLMLSNYLKANDTSYGDYAAHNGLWEMAQKTDHDVMVRLALVPRVLEARGLDVTPVMIAKLRNVCEYDLVEILEIIHREEIGHVLIGSRWFHYACKQRDLSPDTVFIELLHEYMQGAIQGPFDFASRLQAGFTEDEIQQLVEISASRETIV
ncbi:MAG: ferritin-like domain-containing protein [Gammaproteobacteria bacterium]